MIENVTERKRVEDALRESEERYRSLVELMPDAVVVHQEGIIVYVNPACVRIAGGKSPEDFVGKPLDLFVSPEYREVVAGQIRRMQQEGTATPLAEQELRPLDGRAIRVDITATPILYQGRPSIMVGFRDITERKQAEETLQFERDQLLSIFDGLEQIVYVTDPVTNEILYTNPFFTKALGRGVVGGLCYREFQGREEPCPFCTNDVILAPKPEPYRWEYYNPILDVHLDIVDRIIRWSDGRDVRLEVAIDITERKRAELALQESEEQFRALLDATPDATVLIDREGIILALNEAMAARSERSIEELRGTCAYDLFPPDLAASRKKWADEAFSSARPIRMTDEYEGRIFDHILFPVRGANGQVRRLAGISSDVTERKQVERIRREAYDRIEQNLEQFAILADHIRQPLQVILGMTELLDEGTATERIREQVERINAVVKQLDRGWVESREVRAFLRRHETA
ncbi:MAG: hypothetical protein PWR16_498 [Methanoculleus sp.]|nr:hypothetical protein [Methanoculleus sp.]